MSQHLISDLDIDPNVTSGTELSEILDRVNNAQNSSHIGSARPPYAVAGLIWVDLDTLTPYFYDGVTDHELGGILPGGDAEQVLAKVDATDGNVYWKTIAEGGGGGGGLEWQANQQIDFTAEDGKGYPLSTGITMTLPAGADNIQIGWKDFNNVFDSEPCYIKPAVGEKIEQFEADEIMTLDTRGQGGTLVYIQDRWLIVDATELGDPSEEAPSGIKSVQRLEGTLTGAAQDTAIPINEVDMNKTFINVTSNNHTGSSSGFQRWRLTSPTNVQLDTVGAQTGKWAVEVVEFW